MATTIRGDDNFDTASPIGSAVAPTVTCQVN